MMFGELRNTNAHEKENSNAFHFKGSAYTEVSTIEGLQSELGHELQREQEDMVQKLKMLKEVVENLRFDEVTSSWQLQVEQLYREVVLRSNQVEELPSNVHLEKKINKINILWRLRCGFNLRKSSVFRWVFTWMHIKKNTSSF